MSVEEHEASTQVDLESGFTEAPLESESEEPAATDAAMAQGSITENEESGGE